MASGLTDQTTPALDMDVDRTIMIDPAWIHRFIAIVTGLLVVGAGWYFVAEYALGLGDTVIGSVSRRLFNLNGERGLWAGCSSMFLLTTATAVFLSTWAHGAESSLTTYSRRWRLLAFAMAFLAFDEAFRIHEWIDRVLRARLELTGFLHYGWVIPYGVAAATIAVLMARPLSALPRRDAGVLLAGGLCYVVGAAGAEMIGGQLATVNAPMYLREAEVVVEEMLEWVGVWVFFAGVLRLLSGAALRCQVSTQPIRP